MEEAILAWELNGDPIPLAHGGPLRLIIPGYYGVNNVKYVKRLAFTPEQTMANIQSSGYRVRPVGVKGTPNQPSMWEMNLKSFVTHPAGDGEALRAGLFGHGVLLADNGVSTAGTLTPATEQTRTRSNMEKIDLLMWDDAVAERAPGLDVPGLRSLQVSVAADLPDVRLGLVTCEPVDRIPPDLRRRLAGVFIMLATLRCELATRDLLEQALADVERIGAR